MRISKSIQQSFIAAFLLCFALSQTAQAQVFELRTYTTNEGKLDNLHARFRDHTIKLFDKHGMKSVGYWVPTDEEKSKNTLIYVLEHRSQYTAAAAWTKFINDPEWKAAFKASRVDGPLLAKAPESVFMKTTDYSPKFEGKEKGKDVVYELRTYRCNEGKLKGLDSRFRDHTIELFNQHGLESVAYWHPVPTEKPNDTLIYILRHESRDAAKKAWKAFGQDPNWKKVAKESQKEGRFLRERPEAVYMTPTDYSAMK